MNKKIKVVVCGSTFGQLYLKALKEREDIFEIVGLLGTGSERSRRCAEEYGILLFTDIDKIPDNIDLACIAVRTAVFGGKGTEIALQLLEKGIHVLQEHPAHPKDMEQCYRVARKKNLIYFIGNLYPHLKDVQRFIRCANHLNNKDKLLYVDVMFSGQVSYPLIKILQLSMPNIQNFEVQHYEATDRIFQLMYGKLGEIPLCMQMNNEVVPEDPNNYMHLLFQVTFFYTSGHLTLNNPFGPLVWHPRMIIPIQTAMSGTLNIKFPDNVYEDTGYILSKDNHNKTFEQILTVVWPRAIQHDLLQVYQQLIEGKIDIRINQRELLCARQWNQITKDFGYSKVIPKQTIASISAKTLEAICKGGNI